MNKNSVIFKGRNDGILIILDSEIPFEELKENLEKKVLDAKGFFSGAKTSVTFKGRELSDENEFELLEIIAKTSGLNISFVNKREISANIMDNSSKKAYLTANENITSFHKGSIRSGQELRFSGSIVVIGDVNPGGQIIAEGNIIVLGTLKGLAHAGCKGSSECFIAALNMKPAQLRIGDLITYFPKSTNRKIVSQYACIQNGEISINSILNS